MEKLDDAVRSGVLLESARSNTKDLLAGVVGHFSEKVVTELVDGGAWQ